MIKWFYNSKLAKWLTPLGTCHTITLGCFVFTERTEERVTERLRLHETTHAIQFLELFILGCIIFVVLACLGASWWWLLPCSMLFYVWYLVEWLVRLIKDRDWEKAYKDLPFEKEAVDVSYKTCTHKPFGFIRYYF